MRRNNQIFRGTSFIIILFVANSAWASWQQNQKLSASDADQYDSFGYSVSIDGDYAIIGACYDDGSDANSGSAFIFKRVGGTWSEEDKLVASDGVAFDRFGYSVSISGEYAIISAPSDDGSLGSAYIFKRSGTTWSQQAKLIASDGLIGDEFGCSVAISGDYALVGAYMDSDMGVNWCGSVYVFEKPPGGWTDTNETTKLFALDPMPTPSEHFGFSVAIDGNTAIVGARFSSPSAGLPNAGAAYIFKREGIYWNPQPPRLTASDASGGDWFGSSVSISGDYAIVGAPGNDDFGGQTGSAYIFKNMGGPVWIEQAKLMASNAAANDWFGRSTSISGNSAIVGTFTESAYIFLRRGTSWKEMIQLTAWDGVPGDSFGFSVSIGPDEAIVGAAMATGNATQSGAAYTFERICPAKDLTGDCCVDYLDLREFLQYWLVAGPYDWDGSGTVDLPDYAELSNDWEKYN